MTLSRTLMFAAMASALGMSLATTAVNAAKPKPKLTLAQAQKIALHARAGKITDHELEAEKGGSGLRYSFDIKSGAKTYEVGVDAVTGKLLENVVEGPNPD